MLLHYFLVGKTYNEVVYASLQVISFTSGVIDIKEMK